MLENRTQKQIKKQIALWCAVSAAITGAVFVAALITAGIIPFGSSTLAKNDALFQYVPFLSEFAQRIKEGGSLLYSWQTGGGNFYGTALYYLLNPFNLFVLLFPEDQINLAYGLVVCLNTVMISITACFYLQRHFGKSGIMPVAFALTYTFSGFYLAYYYNTMWLAALWLLPLIAHGIEKIVGGGKAWVYLFSLCAAIMSNFYLGYMLCIFSVLYFFVCIFSRNINKKGEDDVRLMPTLLKFGGASLAAGGISAVTLIPVVYSLSNAFTKSVFEVDSWYFFNPLDFLCTHLTGVVPNGIAMTQETLPSVSLGALALTLLPLYAFTKRLSKNEKGAHIALMLIFILSFEIPSIYYIWHGMSAPAGLPYRFAFLYCFIAVKMAYVVFIDIKQIKKALFIIPPVLLGAIYAYCAYNYSENYGKALLLGGILTAVIFVLILIMRFTSPEKRLLKAAASVCAFAQLAACMGVGLIGADSNNYLQQGETVAEAKEIIGDDGFYRMEFSDPAGTVVTDNASYQVNTGSTYGFNGISIFSSLTDQYYASFQYTLGNPGNVGNSYGYRQQTPVYNTLFNIGYVIDAHNTLSQSPYYAYLGDADGSGVYKTVNTLGVGVLVNKEICDWDGYTTDSFSSQSLLWQSVTGETDNVFTSIEPYSADLKGCELTAVELEEDGSEIQEHFDRSEIEELFKQIPGYYSYKITENNYSMTFTVVPEETQNVFLLAQSGNLDIMTVEKGGETTVYKSITSEKGLADLGMCEAGEAITVTFTSSNGDSALENYAENDDAADDSLYFLAAGFNDDVYQAGLEALRKNGTANLEVTGDTTIEGSVTANEDCVMFIGIPCDEGWSVYIDGEQVELVEHSSHVLMFKVAEGEHTIEMEYTPQGLEEGAFVSAATILIVVLALLFSRVRKMKEELIEEQSAPTSPNVSQPDGENTEQFNEKDIPIDENTEKPDKNDE